MLALQCWRHLWRSHTEGRLQRHIGCPWDLRLCWHMLVHVRVVHLRVVGRWHLWWCCPFLRLGIGRDWPECPESHWRIRDRSGIAHRGACLHLNSHRGREVDGTCTLAPTRFMCNWWAGARWRGVDLAVCSCIRSNSPGDRSTEGSRTPKWSISSLTCLD